MHLTSVTLRGFKSFADRTRLDLDLGLVAVVGPNGAGKSNLIDALLWALGTQGTRVLRADRMEDVIFTGTVGRGALGMAHVVLTFDNTGKRFPLDFSEVQVGRTLFRDGASEYSINGAGARLVDVQELLSEAGIGREMHVVVAQGQVEEIVQSRPEELRGFVEEAAGISKHRRRKERSLRKLDAVEQDISRAADLANELRRQLRPLQQQAERAVRHLELTAALRETSIRILSGELEQMERERRRAFESRDSVTSELASLRARLEVLRAGRAEAEQRLDDTRRAGSSLRRGLDRLRASQAAAFRAVLVLRERAAARTDRRRLEAVTAKLDGLQADELELRAGLEELAVDIEGRERSLAELRGRQAEASQTLGDTRRRLDEGRRELAHVDAEARSADQSSVSARSEAKGADDREARASERIARAEQRMEVIRQDIERLDAEAGRAAAVVERLEAERRASQGGVEDADARLRTIESQAAVLAGRLESLRVAREIAASRRKSVEEFDAASGTHVGARGVLADLVRVSPGLEAAVEAVLGPALDALVVSGASLADAVAKAEEAGYDLLVAPTLAPGGSRVLPQGVRPLAASVEAPGFLRGTVDALLDAVYLVDDWDAAVTLAGASPHATFVTPAGRVLRPRGLSRPATPKRQATIGIAGALERTEESIKAVDAERGRFQSARERHRRDVARLDAETEDARSQLHEAEGRIAAAADRLRELGAEQHAASLEREMAEQEHEARIRKAEQFASRRDEQMSTAEALRGVEVSLSAEAAELDVRLQALRSEAASIETGLTEALTSKASLAERLRGVERSRDELRQEIAAAEAAPIDPLDVEWTERVHTEIEALVARVESDLRAAARADEEVDNDLRVVTGEWNRIEVSIAALEPRVLSASEALSRLDLRMEEVGTRLAREFEIPPSQARVEFPADRDLDAVRQEQSRLEAELRRLGPVNPLAAEEIAELDERRAFLESQLEDLRKSKRDLLKLVRAAEERMREMLTEAVRDADIRFREVTGLLFPEGDGRLRLVADAQGEDAPEDGEARTGSGSGDVLDGRLEIEVRLGRKGHRRLQFLSGGEKALAGLAFLFALHLARPTPFLVLDEVDAPLDDANLGRFLRLLDSLRTQTQVLVVTHQKRTMERADCLVGVTLGSDGTSRILTQRMREHADASTS